MLLCRLQIQTIPLGLLHHGLVCGLLCGLLCSALSSTVHAQGIRQYNPNTGSSDAIPTQQHTRPTAADTTTTPTTPPAVRQAPAVLVQRPSAVPAPRTTPNALGEALIFVDVSNFNSTFVQNLKTLQTFTHLGLTIYLPELEAKSYMPIAKVAGFDQLDPERTEFTSDAGGLQAKRQRITTYNTIVYRDPNNTRRIYDLTSEFDNFLRHLTRINREIKTP